MRRHHHGLARGFVAATCVAALAACSSGSSTGTKSSGGGLGLTLPLPLGGSSNNKAKCSLTIVSSKVLIKAPKKKALKRRLDRAVLSYKCRRAAKLTLTGSFTETLARAELTSGVVTNTPQGAMCSGSVVCSHTCR